MQSAAKKHHCQLLTIAYKHSGSLPKSWIQSGQSTVVFLLKSNCRAFPSAFGRMWAVLRHGQAGAGETFEEQRNERTEVRWGVHSDPVHGRATLVNVCGVRYCEWNRNPA